MVVRNEIPGRPYDVAINVFAELADFDYTFTVSACRADEAERALNEAFDRWFGDEDTGFTFYEELENALKELGIPFESSEDEEE